MTRDDIQAASTAIRAAIEQTAGPLPPPFLVEFLLRHWRVYLARVHAQDGGVSAPWQEAVATTHRLLWSVAPKITTQERADLASTLKSLLEGIRHGAKGATMADGAQQLFFNDLSKWHLWLINPTTNPMPATADVPDAEVDFGATLRLDAMDPRYRKIMDYLESDNIEEIAI